MLTFVVCFITRNNVVRLSPDLVAFLQIALGLVLLYLVAVLFHVARTARSGYGNLPIRRAAAVIRRRRA
jgi:hypothetical protein